MRWMGKKSRGPIGIDLGSRWIKAAQVSSPNWQPALEAAVAMPRLVPGGPLSDAEVHRLAEVLERQGFTGRQVVLAAPNESLLTGTLNLPPRGSGAPVDQIARMELSRMHKCDPQGIELSYWDLPSVGGGNTSTVMAVACPHAAAAALLDRFESVGLDVVGMDVHWLALARACQPLWESFSIADESGTPAVGLHAILDLGWRGARLTVLRETIVTFERVLTEGGLNRLAEELKSKFRLDDLALDCVLRETPLITATQTAGETQDEATPSSEAERRQPRDQAFDEVRRTMGGYAESLVRELQLSLDYAVQSARGESVRGLALTGGGALNGLDAFIAEQLNLKTQTVTAIDLVQVSPALTATAGNPTLIAALGLATYAC